ncbi:MAG: TIGR04282 family arsenosugar biosynthesis glycosyltransferase [Nitrospira sp.]|nr:TIGR04282 family arsenosugar biosynthesis glycosyltransferase [Nitrospira sp.]
MRKPSDIRPGSQVVQAENALIIFAKAPIAGEVKTRLCPPLTHDEAATLHGSFVLDMLERTKLAMDKWKLPFDRYLACAPSSQHVFFKILEARHRVRLIDQLGADLGARMREACSKTFGCGHKRLVLVGTDVPTVPLEHYRKAAALLEEHDVVLGPAQDGGYYLLGLAKRVDGLFDDIPWSTGQVFRRTCERAEALGLRVAWLPEWRDVDTIDDLIVLIEAGARDMTLPKAERQFSARTAGTLQLLAKRIRSRA